MIRVALLWWGEITTRRVVPTNRRRGCGIARLILKNGWKAMWAMISVSNMLIQKALSNIEQITGFPEQPDTIYLLTSFKGILVSEDGGATFAPYPLGTPPTSTNNWAYSLTLSGTPVSPIFWVTGLDRGLWRMRGGEWTRTDGNADGGCVGLPDTKIPSVLSMGNLVIVGTAGDGLWVIEDEDTSCHQIFDAEHQYTFVTLSHASVGEEDHYLAGVEVTLGEPKDGYGRFQLLHLCPQADDCTEMEWKADPAPLWDNGPWLSGSLAHVAMTSNQDKSVQWVLFSGFGKVFEGDCRGESEPDGGDSQMCTLL